MWRTVPLAITTLLLTASLSFAQAPAAQPGNDRDPMAPIAGDQSTTATDAQSDEKNELDLPIDDSIKLQIAPVVPSSIADRVLEDTTVTVACPGAVGAKVFIVPVDSPYGGRVIGKPRLVGKSTKPGNQFAIRWTGKDSDPYVKVFAVVRKRSQPEQEFRSRTVDIAIGGARLVPRPINAAP